MTPASGEVIPQVTSSGNAPQALWRASLVALVCFIVSGLSEAVVIRTLRPTALELDWISDTMLSIALGASVYLWLHLRATRVALTERERAQLVLHTQLELAESLQRRLLPAVPDPEDGIEWAATLTSAGRIGGDFFDFVRLSDGAQLMLVADVSGKGIAAAMALTLLRSTFRRLALDTGNPAQLAARMSVALHDEWHGSPYVTGVIARLDVTTRRLTYTNAGHPRGILLRERHGRSLGEGGPPLGLLRQALFTEETISLSAEDIGIFVTDGVSEALDDMVRPWSAAVLESIGHAELRSAARICQRIVSLAQSGQGPLGVDGWSDDRTVVVFKVSGQNLRQHESRVDPA